LALIIGTLLPDIIDKTFFLLGIGGGRMISHTLLFTFLSFSILHLITKGNKSVSLPFLVGTGSHLILDLPYVPLLYPFIYYDFPVIEEPIWYWITNLFKNPLIIITELIGIGILLLILIHNKLYHAKDIIYYLKGTIDLLREEKLEH